MRTAIVINDDDDNQYRKPHDETTQLPILSQARVQYDIGDNSDCVFGSDENIHNCVQC